MQTTQQLKDAIAHHARASGLDVQCVCDGSFLSEVAIIAEAPGEREVDVGRPLVGSSGTILWNMLRKHGISRSSVYITNVSKRQVSIGKNDKRFPINKHELENWFNILQWELSQLPNLKYVLVLGNYALQAITGHTGIMSWRGSVLDSTIVDIANSTHKPVKVVCTLNPAMILREPKHELVFNMDLDRLKRVIDGKWVEQPVVSHINPSYSDAMDFISQLDAEKKPVAYDIEVIANETACIGFANKTNEAMSINYRTQSENRYTLEEERKLLRRINAFLGDPENKLVAQNGMFDASWLMFKDRISPAPHHFDTMLAHHCLYPQLPHNLGFITTQYTTRPYYKDEKNSWKEGGDIDSFWHYNAQDCCNTLSAYIAMNSELKQQSLDKFFYEHIMGAQPYLIQMTVGGLLIDEKLRANLKTTLELRVQQLLEEFHEAVQDVTNDKDYHPNPSSPKQMVELLFGKLKLVGRGTSTDRENRERMYAHPATTDAKRKVLRSINEYAEEKKFFSTYVDTGLDDDSRMRSTYNQTGVQSAPGRLSSSGMLWRNSQGVQTGSNLQNQPERAHPMFIADPGYCFVYFDLAQAEARFVGWDANISTWIDQFERARIDGSYDAHRALASEMFGVPYNDVPTNDRNDDGSVTIRYIAKRCRHGLNYRMGPERLSTVTGLSMAKAHEAYRIYHKINPELQRWWSELEAEVKKTRTLFNAYGRRYIVLERLSQEALESIVAFRPQSTIGDKVVRVIRQCMEDDRWPDKARMALNIHDALIALVPKWAAMRCLSLMKKYAEEPIMVKGRPMIIPADCKMSVENEYGHHSWGSLKPIEVEAAK